MIADTKNKERYREGQGDEAKDEDVKKNTSCHDSHEEGRSVPDCTQQRGKGNATSGNTGGDTHCLT